MTRQPKRPPQYVWVQCDLDGIPVYTSLTDTSDVYDFKPPLHRYELSDPKPKRKGKR